MTTREYPDRPIVGVGAVIVRDHRVVLARRARPPLLGRWSLPGGVVELGETLRSATEREVLEETGLTVKAGVVVEILDRIIPGEGGRTQYHYVLVDFLCECLDGDLHAGSDVAEVIWAREDELENYELEDLALAVIKKAFNRQVEGKRTA
ncbi:MAG TPA: NUDIX hydrolase [Candidatus Angelobacter sp.]